MDLGNLTCWRWLEPRRARTLTVFAGCSGAGTGCIYREVRDGGVGTGFRGLDLDLDLGRDRSVAVRTTLYRLPSRIGPYWAGSVGYSTTDPVFAGSPQSDAYGSHLVSSRGSWPARDVDGASGRVSIVGFVLDVRCLALVLAITCPFGEVDSA